VMWTFIGGLFAGAALGFFVAGALQMSKRK
jgi:hypothetical protein